MCCSKGLDEASIITHPRPVVGGPDCGAAPRVNPPGGAACVEAERPAPQLPAQQRDQALFCARCSVGPGAHRIGAASGHCADAEPGAGFGLVPTLQVERVQRHRKPLRSSTPVGSGSVDRDVVGIEVLAAMGQ